MRHLTAQVEKPPHRQKTLLLICAVLIFLIGGWMLLDYGKWRMIYQEMAGAIAQKTLTDTEISQNDSGMGDELGELQKKVTILERTAQVDKTAQDEVRKMISELEKENLELREELGFYQNIMASISESRGLKVQGFRLEASKNKQRYKFELVLTRIVKGGRVASGDVSIVLNGNGNSGQMDYDLKELLKGKDSAFRFKIKHFKRIGGIFTLPDGFVPESVKITIQPHEEDAKPIEKVYQWTDIIT